MRFKVFLELVLVLQTVLLSFVDQDTVAVDLGLVNPLDGGVWKLVWVDVYYCWVEFEFCSTIFYFFFSFLPCWVEGRILDELLWLIVVLKLHLLKVSNLGVPFTFLTIDIHLFDIFSIFGESNLSFVDWLITRDWMRWISFNHSIVIICIYHNSTLS